MLPNTTIPVSGKTSIHYTTKLLIIASTTWFVVTTLGLWLFGIYILLFYGKTTLQGDFATWNNVLPHGYVSGDWQGNLVVGLHVLLAAILVVGGPLQFIPSVRRYAPRFHRWIGKFYIITAMLVSTGGLVMVWTRGAVGDTIQHVSISILAIYCNLFAFLSFRHAKAGRFDKHKAWALRLFMVVNGVWFFRIGLMCWLLIQGGPVGFNPKTFSGPFLTALAVFVYAVPVSIGLLELYFHAQKTKRPAFRLCVSLLLFLATAIQCAGIFGAALGMWLPRLTNQ